MKKVFLNRWQNKRCWSLRLCIDSMTSQSSVANSIYFSNKKHSKKKYNFLQMYKCNPTYRFIEKFIIQFSFYIKITPPAKEVTTFPLFLFLSLSLSLSVFLCLCLSLPAPLPLWRRRGKARPDPARSGRLQTKEPVLSRSQTGQNLDLGLSSLRAGRIHILLFKPPGCCYRSPE